MGRRTARLGEAIRDEVAQMVSFELKDPRIGLATVTRVEVTPDLGHARVHVSVAGSEAERKASLQALRNSAGYVRRELAQRLGIRQVPEVDFRHDKGLEATERVARLLEEDRRAAAERPEADLAGAEDGSPGARAAADTDAGRGRDGED